MQYSRWIIMNVLVTITNQARVKLKPRHVLPYADKISWFSRLFGKKSTQNALDFEQPQKLIHTKFSSYFHEFVFLRYEKKKRR